MDPEVPVAEGDRAFLLVRSGGACYALPAAQVRHVVRGLACYPVPGGRPHLLGLAQFAGEPLAILDLHAIAEGAAPQAHHRTTVILGRGARESWTAVGFAVTEALRVQSLAGATPVDQSSGLVTESVELEGELIRVVDTEVFFEEVRPGGGNSNA